MEIGCDMEMTWLSVGIWGPRCLCGRSICGPQYDTLALSRRGALGV